MSDQQKPSSNPSGRASKRLLLSLVAGVCLFVLACLLTLIALFYAEENWRGKRAWQECRQQLEAKGANLDWASRIPASVPDEQNVFEAPKIAEWFVKAGPGAGTSNSLTAKATEITDCARLRSGTGLIEVDLVTSPSSAGNDAKLTLHYRSSPGAELSNDELESFHRVIDEARASALPQGRTLTGAQGSLVFEAGPSISNQVPRVVLQTDSMPDLESVKSYLERVLSRVGPRRVSGLRVEVVGTGHLRIFSGSTGTVSATDYLACSDRLQPALDSIRAALKRPYARRDGDYTHPWAVPIPNFVAVRTVAQVLAQRAQCYLLLAQPEKALEELTLLRGLERLLDPKPVTLVAAMINVAITGLYSDIVGQGLRLKAWHEPQLISLQQQLQEIHLMPKFLQSIDTERAASCHTLQTTTASELNSIFAIANKPGLWAKITDPDYMLSRWMPRGWVYQNMKEIAVQDQSFLDSVETNGTIKPAQVEAIGRKSIDSLEKVSPFNVLARIIMPNYLKAFQNTVRNQVVADEAFVACALERYRLAHNEYPTDLQALMPGLVDKLPIDPLKGAALQYRRVEPDHFLLYSIGWDQADNTGMVGANLNQGNWVWDSNS